MNNFYIERFWPYTLCEYLQLSYFKVMMYVLCWILFSYNQLMMVPIYLTWLALLSKETLLIRCKFLFIFIRALWKKKLVIGFGHSEIAYLFSSSIRVCNRIEITIFYDQCCVLGIIIRCRIYNRNINIFKLYNY